MAPIHSMEVCHVTCVEPTPSRRFIQSRSFKQELVAFRPIDAAMSRVVVTATATASMNIEQYFWRIKCGEASNSHDLIREFNLLNDLKKSSQQSIVAPTKCANFSTGVDSFFLFDLAHSISDCPEFLRAADPALKLQCLRQVLLALQAIHHLQLVHLQLLPENIIIVTNPITKVVRFQLQCFTFLGSDDTSASSSTMHAEYSQTEFEDGDMSSESTMMPESSSAPSHNPNEITVLSRQLHVFSAPESRDMFSRSHSSNSSNSAQNLFSFGCIAFYILCNGQLPFSASASWEDIVYSRSYEAPEMFVRQIKANLMTSIGNNQNPVNTTFMQLIAETLLPNPTNRPSLSTLLSHPLLL